MAPTDADNAWDGANYNADISMVEIPLDEEMINTLHRRSRRQLRNIQEASSAVLKLCRMRKILQVSGTREAINFVRTQLQCLNGPRKQVPAAIWAELMRTRTQQLDQGPNPPSRHASIAGLQEMTGCRIHIERSRCELRLFGPDDSVAKASDLIDALVHEVAEERVAVVANSVPAAGQMQALGEKHGVMLLKDDGVIVVLGMRNVTHEAAENLRRCILRQEDWPEATGEQEVQSESSERSPVAGVANPNEEPVQQAMTMSLAGYAKAFHGNPGNQTGAANPPPRVDNQKQWCPQEEPAGMRAMDHSSHEHPSCCPTCGAGRFCVGCGATVWQNGGHWVWVGQDRCPDPTVSPMHAMNGNEQVCAPQMGDGTPKQVPQFAPMMYMNYDGAVMQPAPNGMIPGSVMMPVCFPDGMPAAQQGWRI